MLFAVLRLGVGIVAILLPAVAAAADYGKAATLLFYVVTAAAIFWFGLTVLIFRALKGRSIWRRIGVSVFFFVFPIVVLALRFGLALIAERANL